MRRRVEYYLRAIFFKYVFYLAGVADTGYKRNQIEVSVFAFKFLFYVVGVVFVYIQNYQSLGVVRRYLSAEFAAYRAASAGYENDLIFDITDYFVYVYFYLLSSE